MTVSITDIMEQASVALGKMRYLEAERLCMQALAAAREAADWDSYARILLPLQEARRQRRMIAAEAGVMLGSVSLQGAAEDWLDAHSAGCFLLTHPHDGQAARSLIDAARTRECYVEVLWADSPMNAQNWALRAIDRPSICVEMAAPPEEWQDRWVEDGDAGPLSVAGVARRPSDYFIDASEKLGDAALEKALRIVDPFERLEAIEGCMAVVTDHEFIHQHLAIVAREAAVSGAR